MQNKEVHNGWGDCAYCGGYDYWSNCGDIVEMISPFHFFIILTTVMLIYVAISND